jgi:hypothetical protein
MGTVTPQLPVPQPQQWRCTLNAVMHCCTALLLFLTASISQPKALLAERGQ